MWSMSYIHVLQVVRNLVFSPLWEGPPVHILQSAFVSDKGREVTREDWGKKLLSSPVFSSVATTLPALFISEDFFDFPLLAGILVGRYRMNLQRNNRCEALGLHISFRWWQSVKNGYISRVEGDFFKCLKRNRGKKRYISKTTFL